MECDGYDSYAGEIDEIEVVPIDSIEVADIHVGQMTAALMTERSLSGAVENIFPSTSLITVHCH